MNLTQFQDSLNFLFKPNAILGIQFFLVLKSELGEIVRIADLGDSTLLESLKESFLETIKSKIFKDEEAQIKPLSEHSTEVSTIHHYDLDELPKGLDILENNLEKVPLFDFKKDSLDSLSAFLIRISSNEKQIVLYKKHIAFNLLKRKNYLYFFNHKNRFENIDKGILRFNFDFDFIHLDGDLYIFNIKTLENNFNYIDILKSRARIILQTIEDLQFVENMDELQEYIDDKTGAKSVLKINTNSIVFQLKFDQIKEFIKSNPKLKRKFHFNDKGNKLILKTKNSRKYLIELLNDSYLFSNLTNQEYISNNKEVLTEDNILESEIDYD